MTLDGEGNFTSWSAGAERLYGYTEAEIVGQSFDVIFSADDKDRGLPEEEMRNAREQGKSLVERWHVRKDATQFFASGVVTPLRLAGLHGYAKIVRDVTASQAARAEAEASARLKDDFLAVMSHELKHPLNLIHVNAQLLLTLPETSGIASARKAGETIERSVVAQARIIDDLLDLSRTQSGKLRLDLAPLDLARAIEPTLKWAEVQTGLKGIAFEHSGFDREMVVLADAVRIEQIVWNLLSNAIKFTASGGKISARLSEQGDEAVLEIADNGRGIAPEFLPHVFGMFQQEEGYKSRREGGLGIGLGLTRDLIARQGGRVEAASRGSGRGATFTVRLPLHERTDFAPLDPVAEDKAALAGVRILLVDDAPDALESFALLLQTEGAVVTCANGGAAALKRSEEASFDLIISDVGMPDMDGTQMVAELRRRPATELVPAIALTGYGRPQDVNASLAAGFTAHLVKPIDMQKLRRLALDLVPRRKRGAASSH
jgi:two-component system CheB/CheR fusion protein